MAATGGVEEDETITEWQMIARICGAALFASVIGFEREIKNKPATVRMHILVGAGAATFVGVALLNTYHWRLGDVNRVAAGVASGVGFLGAGTIFKVDDKVAGLSTAAGIWIVAAIGFATANGYWMVALFCTLIVLVVQFGMLFFLSAHFWREVREKFTMHATEDDEVFFRTSTTSTHGVHGSAISRRRQAVDEEQTEDNNAAVAAGAAENSNMSVEPNFRHSREE